MKFISNMCYICQYYLKISATNIRSVSEAEFKLPPRILKYFKRESPIRVRAEYIQTFPGEVPPSRFTIHEIVKKFETTGSVTNKTRIRKRTILTEETLDEKGASLERTPTKSIPKLAQQVGISESYAHRATKLLKLKPHKCTSVHSLKQGDISSILYKVR